MAYKCAYCGKEIEPGSSYIEVREENWVRTVDKHQFCNFDHVVGWLPDNLVPNLIVEQRENSEFEEGAMF